MLYEKIKTEIGESEMLLYKEIEIKYFELVLSVKYYRELFKNDSRVDVLNRTAPALFIHLQKVLLHNIVMAISRLSDPPKSAGKKNLSLVQLDTLNRDGRLPGLGRLLDDFNVKAGFVKDWRNKIVGHNDFEVNTSSDYSGIPSISSVQIEASVKSIHSVLNYISESIALTTMGEGLNLKPEWNILFASLVDGEVLKSLAYDQSKGKEIPTLSEARFTAQQQWD